MRPAKIRPSSSAVAEICMKVNRSVHVAVAKTYFHYRWVMIKNIHTYTVGNISRAGGKRKKKKIMGGYKAHL